MLGATEIIKLTQTIADIKTNLDEAENKVVGLLQSKGEGVGETCEEAYTYFEDVVVHANAAMEILGEEFE